MVKGGSLTQVALIVALCCAGHICMVGGGGGGGGCSCMLLLHPVATSADAGPDLCTLCPDLCTLHLWCFPEKPALTLEQLALCGGSLQW